MQINIFCFVLDHVVCMTKQRHKQTHSLNIYQQSKDGCGIVVENLMGFLLSEVSKLLSPHSPHTQSHFKLTLAHH